VLFRELCLFSFIHSLKAGLAGEGNIRKQMGDTRSIQKKKRNPVLKLIILVLTAQWLLSFFGQSFFPGIPHTGGFLYMLSVVIVAMIAMIFLS